MTKDKLAENNKVGLAIFYFRETYHITQSKLCQGLCSVATLSRIEAGDRDVDLLLLEALLERLGKTSYHFELILTDMDYLLHLQREEIKKKLDEKDSDLAAALLKDYEKNTISRKTVHKQFIVYCKALLNDLQGGKIKDTIDLFYEAISYTVPDFTTHKITDYYLSFSELNIIINIVQRMISTQQNNKARELLDQLIAYLDIHNLVEEHYRIYHRVAVIASRIYLEEKDYKKALEMSSHAIDINKGSRKMDYIGELKFLAAKALEALLKEAGQWDSNHKECIKLYMQAYYLCTFCEEFDLAEEIKDHLQEEYQWAGID